jgi:hypothetical protein
VAIAARHFPFFAQGRSLRVTNAALVLRPEQHAAGRDGAREPIIWPTVRVSHGTRSSGDIHFTADARFGGTRMMIVSSGVGMG